MSSFVKPNFFIVGAAKSGTSAMADFLGQHPDVFISPIKEPYYFIKNRRLEKESSYLDLFSKVKSEKMVGEATTGYLFDKTSAVLIKNFYPQAKIIILLRNPIDMSFSLWKYMSVHGNEKESFEQAICDAPNRKSKEFTESRAGRAENYLYIERAKYYKQVKHYYEIFGRGSVKILFFEEFISNPVCTCKEVFEFLDISNKFEPNISVVNPGGVVRFSWLRKVRTRRYPLLKNIFPTILRSKIRTFIRDINVKQSTNLYLTDEERNHLRFEFIKDVEKLKQLTGKKLSVWKDFDR